MTFGGSNVVISIDSIDSLDDATLVDVRSAGEYNELAHLEGAVNIPLETLRDPGTVTAGMLPEPSEFASVMAKAGVEHQETLVAYDDDNGVDAARFLLTAAVLGHEGSLYLLDGDYSSFQRDRYTETTEPDTGRTDYPVPTPASDWIVDRTTVEDAIDSETVLVDTRTAAEYESAHIPGAVQLGWETLVDDETHGLRPRDEIERILQEKGITADRDVVLYCNTARRLSHTFLVLKHLGNESVRFYEGSLTDWIRKDAPDWDPEQLYESVRELAPEGVSALPRELGEDVFSRLHLVGLYTQKQDGSFMLRTKVPCGQLSAEQARTFGEIAMEYARAPDGYGGSEQNPEFGDGFLDITTRQGLQLHWIDIEDVPDIWDRFHDVGLTTVQASGNTLRNVVACPATGLAETDLDVGPIGSQIARRFEGDRKLANLPRKLKIGLNGCHENCARAEIQDIGFTPAEKAGRDGFHARVGGGLSDGPRVATDLDVFLEPEQLVPFSVAVADVFVEHGSYLDTAVNRLRFLVEEWGVERFRAELERHLDFDLDTNGTDLTSTYRGDHVGVHSQGDGRSYVGVNVATGRMHGSDLVEFADLSETYGSGELRTTPNQNLVIPDVRDEDLDALLAEPLLTSYKRDPGPFSRGIVTCTGAEFCGYGLVETKSRGLRWARELDEWMQETDHWEGDRAFRVHLSGCSASCAQPQVADVGLRGERYRDERTERPAADVGLGGDLSRSEFIDWVAGSVPIESVPAAIRRVIAAYVDERVGGESFASWTSRKSAAALRDDVRGRSGASTLETEAK